MALLSKLLDLLFPPRCPFCGGPEPGENGPCARCKNAEFWLDPAQAVFPGKAFLRCVCVGWYQNELRQSVRRFKFQNHPEYAKAYGPMLAKNVRLFLPGAYDVVTWIPVSAAKLETRGYDQARLLAEALAGTLGKTAVPLLEKSKDTPAQSSLTDPRQRWENVAGVYTVPDPAAAAGKRVLLIDDILTTGATMEEGAKTLRRAGASQVVAAAFCKTPPPMEK